METVTTSKKGLQGATIGEIREFIAQWEKMAGAYFWHSPGNASSRRSYEKYHSREISFELNGIKYHGIIDVSCSCKNVYCTRKLIVGG